MVLWYIPDHKNILADILSHWAGFSPDGKVIIISTRGKSMAVGQQYCDGLLWGFVASMPN